MNGSAWRWWRGLLAVICVSAGLSACSSRGSLAGAPAAWMERFEIISRRPAYGSANFRPVGAYELVTGVAAVRIDPFHPANRQITDLGAAMEEDGFVRYRADVVILRPVDAAKGSKVLLVEPPSRGRRSGLAMLNDGALGDAGADAGHGWAMRNGHTVVWVGWQGDVPLAIKAGDPIGTRLPVLGAERKPVTGKVMEEWVFDNTEKVSRVTLTYPVGAPGPGRAVLRVRARPDAEPVVIGEEAWRYQGEKEIEITRPQDADAGALYQLIYEARDPPVMGLGLAAIRDVVGFLKSGAADEAGQPAPLGDAKPALTVALGVGQSARLLKEFLWLDFNAAPDGGRVFDATLLIGSGALRTAVNTRWAMPARYSRQHEGHAVAGDQFPFSYGVQVDPVTAGRDGLLARCIANDTCPKLMHVDTSQEFWQARASLVLADGEGRDQGLPDTVRAYLVASTQQQPPARPDAGVCQHLNNPVPYSGVARALLARLIEWARDNRVPPASLHPTVARSSLVLPDREKVGFPDLSGLNIAFPTVLNDLNAVDYSQVPPLPDRFRSYKLLVPRTDRDGNDIDGIRLPDIQVPVGTFTGWNLRKPGFAQGQLCALNGAYLPVANDASLRAAAGDPRPSIRERYPTRLHYVQRMQVAAEQLKSDGWLLDEDVGRWVDRARVQAQSMQLPR